MHILLVGPDLEENLSLRYLAAALSACGHRATIARFDTMEDFHSVVEQARAVELIGLSLCYQIRAPEFLCLARALKQQVVHRPIVAGGHYASCAARELLENHPELDIIAVHEGERTLVELADLGELVPPRLEAISGIVYRDGAEIVATPPREILSDLDALPWPDRTGPARLLAGVPSAYMMGSRGCLGACDYCCITTLHRMVPGRRFRQRAPEKIADEMAFLYHSRGVRQYIFHDDNFLVPSVEKNLARIDALERALREREVGEVGLALKCRPGDVDRQVFTRLRKMGLLRVFLGIESGTADGLASIGRHQSVSEQHRALDLCQELGISTQYTIIIFHPEATPETMLADLEFVRRHISQPFSFCRAEIYTGTPLEQRMRSAGRAHGDYLARTYEYTHPLVARIWEAGQTLLRDRCWAQNHLLGQVVRLDHLVTILAHFYDDPEVSDLVDDFTVLKLAINQDSVELFDAMIRACRELDGDRLDARLQELNGRERSTHEVFQRRLCRINEALHEFALDSVGLEPRAQRPAAPRRARQNLPRHAAAALLAAGLLACGGESSNADNSGGGKAGNASLGGQGGTSAKGGAGGYVSSGGMIEAPPPPMGGTSATGGSAATGAAGGTKAAGGATTGGASAGGVIAGGANTGGTRTGGTAGRVGTGGYVSTGGMFEAPPPPMGGKTATGGTSGNAGAAKAGNTSAGRASTGGYVSSGGMFEAPPPPMGGKTATGGNAGKGGA